MTCQYTYLAAIRYSNSATATVLQYMGRTHLLWVCLRARKPARLHRAGQRGAVRGALAHTSFAWQDLLGFAAILVMAVLIALPERASEKSTEKAKN